MAQRPHTLGDLSTKPSIWADMQATASVTFDATTKRISSVASKGTAGGSFVPPATGNAPLYNPTAFSGVYPAATFNSAEPDYLLYSFANGPAQPATVVYVWQEGAAWKAYEVFVDHDANVAGNRQTVFSAYGGATPVYLIRTVNGSETQVNLFNGNQSAGRVNILIVEYNGASSRIYFNGVVTTGLNLGAVLSASGLAIGGKKGDAATYFGGNMGEVATLPAIFTGDAWDRLTQGTMWKWGQQAKIAAGSTYKDVAPMVDDAAPSVITGSSTTTLGGVGRAATASLAIVGAASLALTGIGSTSTSSAPIAAQAQAPLGAIVSAGAGGIAVAGAGAAALQSISASGVGTLPVLAVSMTPLGDVISNASGSLAVAGAVSSTLGPVGTVSAARADVRGAASTSLGSIVGNATAGGQSLATASSASVLGLISTAATGTVPVVGSGSSTLGTIASNSGSASAVRGAGAASLGAVVSSSASSIPIGAISAANLGGLRADGRGSAVASGFASVSLSGIVGVASATVGQDTDGQLVAPGWTLSSTPRHFTASAIRRSFIVSSTGCKRMLNFPPKYAHEVRNAVVDFAPALSEGEGLIGQPTVAVMKGDLAVAAARIEGTAVHFSLSGGTAATKVVQWVEVHCQTDGDQVLEEVVSVTMLS